MWVALWRVCLFSPGGREAKLPLHSRYPFVPAWGASLRGDKPEKDQLTTVWCLQPSLGFLKRENIQVCPDGGLSRLIWNWLLCCSLKMCCYSYHRECDHLTGDFSREGWRGRLFPESALGLSDPSRIQLLFQIGQCLPPATACGFSQEAHAAVSLSWNFFDREDGIGQKWSFCYCCCSKQWDQFTK